MVKELLQRVLLGLVIFAILVTVAFLLGLLP